MVEADTPEDHRSAVRSVQKGKARAAGTERVVPNAAWSWELVSIFFESLKHCSVLFCKEAHSK